MYSRIRYDIFFKKIFQQEHLLKAFLNTVLQDELTSPILSLNYQPTEFLTKAERKYLNIMKHCMIDVSVTTEDGSRALVEIQKGTDQTDLVRFADYQCRNFSHQFQVGEDYSQQVSCYSICWLFDMTPPHNTLKERLRIISDKEQTTWNIKWEIIAVYPRCIKQEHLVQKSLDALEEWMLLDVVTDMNEAQRIKELVRTKEVQEAFEQLDISGLTDEEIEELEFQEAVSDRYKMSYTRRMRSIQYKKACDIAKELFSRGMDVQAICEVTKLTEQEVNACLHEA